MNDDLLGKQPDFAKKWMEEVGGRAPFLTSGCRLSSPLLPAAANLGNRPASTPVHNLHLTWAPALPPLSFAYFPADAQLQRAARQAEPRHGGTGRVPRDQEGAGARQGARRGEQRTSMASVKPDAEGSLMQG